MKPHGSGPHQETTPFPLLTLPEPLKGVDPVLPTGNEYLALPDIRPEGRVQSLNLLLRSTRSLLEFRGEPLLAPALEVQGKPWPLEPEGYELLQAFLPRFRYRAGGHRLQATYFAPPGFKGLVVLLEFGSGGDKPLRVRLGLEGRLTGMALSLLSRRPLPGPHRAYWNPWSRALVLEAGAGLPLAALAFRDEGGNPPEELPQGDPPWAYRLLQTREVAPQGTVRAAFYLGLAPEGDGAGLHAVDLARHGVEALLEGTLRFLKARSWPEAQGPLGEVYHRNLFFALFFAAGRTLDTEEWVLLTSKSPRYYVAAAHWTRDALLWAFPAALEADPDLARTWLLAAFRLYAQNPGIHAQYLDGTVLYPGFELDQLAAFYLALGRYVEKTGDLAFLEEAAVAQALPRLEAALARWYDPQVGLARTFLLPSDDPAPYPYVTYDNALLWAGLRAWAGVLAQRGRREASQRVQSLALQIRKAILERLVVPGPFGPMFCWASDLEGGYILYDEPPGSLELLPFYGFIGAEDPVYRNTVRWIYSPENPYGPPEAPFATPSCPHAPFSWTLSVANALLLGREGWLERLPRMPLDGGLACESFDPWTGEARTGAGFAACAGFLAFALKKALERRRG